MDGLVPLETLLGHRFANVDLLTTALTHCSYGNEYRVEHNERLEFLGDAVLSLTVAEHLFAKYPLASEGELSPLRASLVCEAKLAELAGVLNVGAYLRLGVGEQQTGGRNRPRLLASSFEAIVGSLYLDGGIGIVKKFLQPLLAKELRLGSGPAVAASDAKSQTEDAKSRLQEITQQGERGKLFFSGCGTDGPKRYEWSEAAVSHIESIWSRSCPNFCCAGRGERKGCGERNWNFKA